MKTLTRTLTIIFVFVFVAAVAAAGIGFAVSGFDVGAFTKSFGISVSNESDKVEVPEFNGESYHTIKIDVSSSDVVLKASSDNVFRITYYENEERYTTEFSNDGGIVKLEQKPKPFKWTMLAPSINIRKNDTATIEVPRSFDGVLDLQSRSGDITVTAIFDWLTTASIKVISGNIKVTELSVFGNVAIEAVSGNVTVNSLSAAAVTAKATSGNIRLTAVRTDGKLTTETRSGDITVTDAITDTLDANATSGRININNSQIDKLAKARTTSGNIRFTGTNAGSYDANATSGNITFSMTGKEKDDFRIEFSITTGTIKIGELKASGINASYTSGDLSATLVKAKATSGNVTITFNRISN